MFFPVRLECSGSHGEASAERVVVGTSAVPEWWIVAVVARRNGETVAEDNERSNDGSDDASSNDGSDEPPTTVERFLGW